MAARKMGYDDFELEDSFEEDLDDSYLEVKSSQHSKKSKKKPRKTIKPRRPDPWDDDWYDSADDLASDL